MKKDFEESFNLLIENIPVDELEYCKKLINDYKNVVRKRVTRDNRIRNDLYSLVIKNKFCFDITDDTRKTQSKLDVVGPVFISELELKAYKKYINNYITWWLSNGVDSIGYRSGFASVRPALLLEDAGKSNLNPGDLFWIGEEQFVLLSNELALRYSPLPNSSCHEYFFSCNSERLLEVWYANLKKSSNN